MSTRMNLIRGSVINMLEAYCYFLEVEGVKWHMEVNGDFHDVDMDDMVHRFADEFLGESKSEKSEKVCEYCDADLAGCRRIQVDVDIDDLKWVTICDVCSFANDISDKL